MDCALIKLIVLSGFCARDLISKIKELARLIKFFHQIFATRKKVQSTKSFSKNFSSFIVYVVLKEICERNEATLVSQFFRREMKR